MESSLCVELLRAGAVVDSFLQNRFISQSSPKDTEEQRCLLFQGLCGHLQERKRSFSMNISQWTPAKGPKSRAEEGPPRFGEERHERRGKSWEPHSALMKAPSSSPEQGSQPQILQPFFGQWEWVLKSRCWNPR